MGWDVIDGYGTWNIYKLVSRTRFSFCVQIKMVVMFVIDIDIAIK